jgi:hypothetical protein
MPWRNRRHTKNHKDMEALRLTVLVVSAAALVFIWWIASANYGPPRGAVQLPPLLRPMADTPPKPADPTSQLKTPDNSGATASKAGAASP